MHFFADKIDSYENIYHKKGEMKMIKNEKKVKGRLLGFLVALIVCFMISVAVPSDVQAASEYIRITGRTKTLYLSSSAYKIPFKKKNVKNIKWKSSNKSVVKVTKTGKIKALKPGKAKITVRAKGKYSKKTYKSTITITVPQISLSCSNTSLQLKKGKTDYKFLNVTGLAKTDFVTWQSDNPSVVSIQSSETYGRKGIFTAENYGTAHVTASYGDKKVVFTVVVTNPVIRCPGNLNKSVKVGKTLKTYVIVENAPDTDLIEWTSSDPSVCTIQASGKCNSRLVITGVSAGSATLTGIIPGTNASITFNIVVQ